MNIVEVTKYARSFKKMQQSHKKLLRFHFSVEKKFFFFKMPFLKYTLASNIVKKRKIV